MNYSYNQISQYLTCPRRYRHRYLDGWQEKDTRAAMLFGRAFERALAAYFLREDAAAVLFREWNPCQNQSLHYSNGDTWDRMLQQGVQLLDRFCQDDRIRIRQPRRNLQIKFTQRVSGNNDFIAYVDAIGSLDGTRCLLEWKTTSSRYPEEPDGLLALDPQLVLLLLDDRNFKSHRSFSSASGWSRSSICAPQLAKSNARSSASWSRTRFGESNQHSFCPTLAFAFRKTRAALAPTWDSVWESNRWSMPLWCGGQELRTLVGLTSLVTRNPPVLPKLNHRRALFVLTKIDEILSWEKKNEAERDTRFVELGRYLCEVRAGQYWRGEQLASFDDFLARRFPESRRKAYYLMSIHEHLPRKPGGN